MKKIYLVLSLLVIGLSIKAETVVCWGTNNLISTYKHSTNGPDWQDRIDCLIDPVLPKGDKKYWVHDNGLIRVMTNQEKDSFYLAKEKQKKKDAIDKKTKSVISKGFSFDNKTFSLSDEAKINWTNLVIAKNLLTYPIIINTIDDEEYRFSNNLQVDSFYGTGIGTVKDVYDSGRKLKIEVDKCTTLVPTMDANGSVGSNCIDSVIDDR